jgi:hypothetical protein
LEGTTKTEAQRQYVENVYAWYGKDNVLGAAVGADAGAGGSKSSSSSGGEGEISFGTGKISTVGAIGLHGYAVLHVCVCMCMDVWMNPVLTLSYIFSYRFQEGGEEGGARENAGEARRDIFYYAKRGLVDEVAARLQEDGGVSLNGQVRGRAKGWAAA